MALKKNEVDWLPIKLLMQPGWYVDSSGCVTEISKMQGHHLDNAVSALTVRGYGDHTKTLELIAEREKRNRGEVG